MSTESIAIPSRLVAEAVSCAGCGAPMAGDQRYCLECGERRVAMSSVLMGAPAPGTSGPARASGAPADEHGVSGGAPRTSTATLLAGVGVLLLAMGVGVLIGRSSAGKQTTAPPQVLSVATAPSGAPAVAGAAEPALSDSWPSGTSGYTVQLQTLPQAATKVSAVEAAKAAAGAKGAKGVGALKSEDFAGLSPGNYVIYAGVYHKRAEAQQALRGLRKSFPAAVVITVSHSARGAGGAASGGAGASGAGGRGAGSSYSHPAPPSVVENLHNTKGQGYEQKSKNLPNVISTG